MQVSLASLKVLHSNWTASMTRWSSFRTSSPFSKDTLSLIPLKSTWAALSSTCLWKSVVGLAFQFKPALTLWDPAFLSLLARREQLELLLKPLPCNCHCIIAKTMKLGRFIARRQIFPLKSKVRWRQLVKNDALGVQRERFRAAESLFACRL